MTSALAIQNRDSDGAVTPQSEWIPIAEAATLTDTPLRTWRARAVNLAASGRAELRPPRTGKGKPTWWVSRRIDRRLSKCPDRVTRDDRVRESLLASHPEHHVQLAYRKAYLVNEWRRRCAKPRAAGQTEKTIAADIAAEARDTAGGRQPTGEGALRVSERTLRTWWQAYNAIGDDGHILGVSALVPRYAGPKPSRDREGAFNVQSRDSHGAVTRSREALEFFFSLYHSPSKHSAKACHKATLAQAQEKGWQWPKSYAATARWLKQTERLDLSSLHREGHSHYSHRHMQTLRIDYTGIEPGERYVCDSTPCDFWVTYRDRQIRPWLIAIEDCRSRCIVGWHLGPAPHQDAIVAALRRAFRDWAVCAKVHIDNGKDYTSRLFTGATKAETRALRKEHGPAWREVLAENHDVKWAGIFGELDIEIARATPFHGWAKGQVERWFRTFEDQFSKTVTTYCGNKPDNRPECHAQMREADDVPTLDQARERVGEYIELYHRTEHTGEGMHGMSPLAVWQTAAHLRKAGDAELMALMDARGVYKVGAGGVAFRIGGDTMRYGAASPQLRKFTGREVFITLDPEHCEHCYAYTADRNNRRFIARLDSVDPIPVNTSIDELRDAIRAVRSRNKHVDKAVREAPHRLRNAAQQISAMRQGELAELRKTGTCSTPASGVEPATIKPVRTGFEAASIPDRTTGNCGTGFQPVKSDALKRLAEFAARKDEPKEPTQSAWSRLQQFVSSEPQPSGSGNAPEESDA